MRYRALLSPENTLPRRSGVNADCRGIVDFFRKEPIIVHNARQPPGDSENAGIAHVLDARRSDICEVIGSVRR